MYSPFLKIYIFTIINYFDFLIISLFLIKEMNDGFDFPRISRTDIYIFNLIIWQNTSSR